MELVCLLSKFQSQRFLKAIEFELNRGLFDTNKKDTKICFNTEKNNENIARFIHYIFLKRRNLSHEKGKIFCYKNKLIYYRLINNLESF